MTEERVASPRTPGRRATRLCAGIDTCSDRLGLALVEADSEIASGAASASACAPAIRVLDAREIEARNAHCEALFPLIAEILDRAERDVSEIGLVGVTAGPGRFTSLRIGLATAQGLALGLGARVVPVSVFDAAAAALAAERANALVAVVLDSGPELHWAVCRAGATPVAPLAGPALAPPDAAAREIAAFAALAAAPLALAGSGAARLAVGAAPPAPETIALPNLARAAAALALANADRAVDPADLEPLYMRPTRAEEIRSHAPAGSAPH